MQSLVTLMVWFGSIRGPVFYGILMKSSLGFSHFCAGNIDRQTTFIAGGASISPSLFCKQNIFLVNTLSIDFVFGALFLKYFI